MRARRIDPARLNDLGKSRIGKKGLTCFIHSDEDGLVEAVCVDFGLSARGATSRAAMSELVLVINEAWQLALESGAAEEFLNRPNNRAAQKQLAQAVFAYRIAETVLWPFRALAEIRSLLSRALVEEYSQPLDTNPHAFA